MNYVKEMVEHVLLNTKNEPVRARTMLGENFLKFILLHVEYYNRKNKIQSYKLFKVDSQSDTTIHMTKE